MCDILLISIVLSVCISIFKVVHDSCEMILGLDRHIKVLYWGATYIYIYIYILLRRFRINDLGFSQTSVFFKTKRV